ncbi:MAG: alpha/beta fold hydrolase [Nitriliruptoraceae bacterium]|nr:alpha/beta fold hydrolase [Nitriliruptoraceae bacterium]
MALHSNASVARSHPIRSRGSPIDPETKPRSSAARLWAVLLLSLALILGGGAFAGAVQSDFGAVDVDDVRFTGSGGQPLSGLLYVPDGVTAETPAPGILAVHGYINSRETQSAFAIELARRGYVVLSLDQSGHGWSGGPAFANGFGGPAALQYLSALDITDADNIGLGGHSMGGWTILAAAATFPDMYQSMVLQGSSTGPPFAADGTPDFPRNVSLVYGEYEEFAALMWETPDPGDVQSTEKMMTLFGTDEEVETGRMYGSIEDGTARIIHRPSATHPGLTIDRASVDHTIDWFDQTLEGARSVDGQTWWLKEAGTLLALLGGVLFLFPFGALLLRTRAFRGLAHRPAPGVGMRGLPWWGAALGTAVISAVTFFPLQLRGVEWVPPNTLFPQEITTGVMFWALANGVIALGLFAVWHGTSGRKAGGDARAYGLRIGTHGTLALVGRSALLAATIAGALYLLLALTHGLFLVDFRFWVFNLHLMNAERFWVFLVYLLPFTVFTVAAAIVLHGQLRSSPVETGVIGRMVRSGLVLAVGVFVLIVVNYIPLFAGGTLLVDTQPLLSIVAYQFVPLLFLIGALITWFGDESGTIYVGAFLSAILISWNNVAATANQVDVASWAAGPQFLRLWLPLIAALALLGFAARRFRGAGGVVDEHDDAAATPATRESADTVS